MRDQDRVSRTWIIKRSQAAEIAAIADGLGVNHSRLVRFLLRYALAEIAAGRLEVKTRPSRYELIGED